MKVGSLVTLLLFVSIFGTIGYFFRSQYQSKQVEKQLRAEVARLMEEEKHAKILVLPPETDQKTGTKKQRLRWASTTPDGKALPGAEIREFQVEGEEVFVDTWQIIFDGPAVREGDPLRGKTLTIFYRIYGDQEKPAEGQPLEIPREVARGTMPTAGGDALVPPRFRQNATGEARDLEQRLWREFYRLMVDPAFAKTEGVRTVQGTAVHKVLVPGKEYRLTLNRQGQILFDGPMDPDPFVEPKR